MELGSQGQAQAGGESIGDLPQWAVHDRRCECANLEGHGHVKEGTGPRVAGRSFWRFGNLAGSGRPAAGQTREGFIVCRNRSICATTEKGACAEQEASAASREKVRCDEVSLSLLFAMTSSVYKDE